MSSVEINPFSALQLLTGDPTAGQAHEGEYTKATAAWNRLNRALTVTAQTNLREADRARQRLARRR